MKLFLSYNKFFLICIFLILRVDISFSFDEEIIEKDLKEITGKLRCMTCQNQTIYDSDADFSKDIKKIIKQKLIERKSKKEINEFLVKRYGEYILFEPQFNQSNLFLWIFPFFIFIISALLLARRIKKNNVTK